MCPRQRIGDFWLTGKYLLGPRMFVQFSIGVEVMGGDSTYNKDKDLQGNPDFPVGLSAHVCPQRFCVDQYN